MRRQEIEQGLEMLSRRELMSFASEMKIVGRYRMTKRTLVRAILPIRMYALLHESPEIIHECRRKELIQMCQLAGIKVKAGSTKQEIAQALRATVVRKPPSKRPRPVRSRYSGAKRAEESKPRIAEPAFIFPIEHGDLPKSYNETRLVALPVDPYLVHAYWELTAKDLRRAESLLEIDHKRSRPVLRFYDVTGPDAEDAGPHSFFDVDIELEARNWYIHLMSPGRSYRVELGLRTAKGRFLPVARSDLAHMPRAWPSDREESLYMRVSGGTQEVIPTVRKQRPRGAFAPNAKAHAVTGLPQATTDEGHSFQSLPIGEKPCAGHNQARPGKARKFDSLLRPQAVHPFDMGQVDLTELSEQKFVSGLSSGLKDT